MKIKQALLPLMSFGVLSVAAQTKDLEFTEYDLDNGLHVILHEDHTTPNVVISMLYHVGSKNENPERTGFAHFFEHLLFEGSTNIERGEYDDYVEKAGGSLNANTSQDRTFYYELLPSNQLELGLWLESERLLHAKVNEKGVETQRQVVKEEKRQRVDNQPYGALVEETFKLVYKEHPYKWVPIGSMEHLDAAQEEDYVNFYQTFYVPNNVVLSIAGDIDTKQAKEWVEKYFASIPSGKKLKVYRDIERLDVDSFIELHLKEAAEDVKSNLKNDYGKLKTEEVLAKYFPNVSTEKTPIPTTSIVEPPLSGEVRGEFRDNIQLPAIVQAYRLPVRGTDEFYAVEMLSKILSDGASSRMQKNIVDIKQEAIAVGAFPFPLEDPGVALIYAIANAGVSIDSLELSINQEVARMSEELISDEELQKLKNSIENDMVSQFASIASVAENLAQFYMYFDGETNLINTEIEKYLAVTKEDIMNAAKKYFHKENRAVLHYLPKEEEEKK